MAADRVRGAVVVLRAKAGEVPAWLEKEGVSERLRDGSFVLPAGQHRIGDQHYAVKCIAEAISADLSFHDDARGLRWLRFGPIATKPVVEGAPAFGKFSGYDLDYEQCVSAVGVWVPLSSVVARRAALAKAATAAPAPVRPQEPDDEVDAPSGIEHRNVVVVRGAPKALPKEFVVLMRLQDGTVLGVGPRNKGWVDWLKKNVPLESLRLLRGPVSDSFLKELTSFEMLDAACKLQGQPMLVMKQT